MGRSQKPSTTESKSVPEIERKRCAGVALHFANFPYRHKKYQCLASAGPHLLFK
jgi:hypothetical protein